MEGYTNFTKAYAKEFKADVLDGNLTGSIISTNSLSKKVDYELVTAEIAKVITCIEMTAESKTLTLGLADGQAMIVINTGDTNALTVKNVKDDTGTTLATGKAILIVGSTTDNKSLVIALN